MRLKQFQLGRIYGIPLIIDYSWPPVALLHIWVVSRYWMVAEVRPPLPLWQNLIIGTIITALFFASVLIHELSHAFVARMEGIRIQDIQLHIFGGWARLIGRHPGDRRVRRHLRHRGAVQVHCCWRSSSGFG